MYHELYCETRNELRYLRWNLQYITTVYSFYKLRMHGLIAIPCEPRIVFAYFGWFVMSAEAWQEQVLAGLMSIKAYPIVVFHLYAYF